MRVIAIVNQKGGCGKTTTTINLAGCLAADGARVLVVDLDPQAHATIAFAQKQLNNEEAALAAYGTAIKADPTNPRAAWWRYQVADIHYHRNSTGRAVNELRDAIKQAKGFIAAPAWLPKAHFYLAEALRGTDKAEAIKEYREYLATSVGSTDPARKEAEAALKQLTSK